MAGLNGDAIDVAERVRAYGEAWRSTAVSTELADRPRAERAIGSLYRAAGKASPKVVWVESPAAGLVAAAFAATSRAWIRGRETTGDAGRGYNQPWNALAEPLDLDLRWARRLAKRVERRLAEAGVTPGTQASWDPLPNGIRAFGLEGTTTILPLLRQVAADARLAPTSLDGAKLDSALLERLGATLLGESWAGLTRMIGDDLAVEMLAAATRTAAHDLVDPPFGSREAVQAMQPGQFDTETPVLASIRDVFGERLWRYRPVAAPNETGIDARLELARAAGPWWALDGLAIVSERPLVARTDDRGRLHADHGPALAWSDGLEVWAWHGVRVDARIVNEPESITVQEIDAERNIERRRVMIERFGEERLIREGGARIVDEDATGRLWRREMPSSWPRDEAVTMVEVHNSTPEPDGTRRTYFLRVPPDTRSAREAVAWTFGLAGDEYQPAVES